MSLINKLKIMQSRTGKIIIACIMVGVMTAVSCITLMVSATCQVVIKDGETCVTVQTTKKTVGEVLAEQEIELSDSDFISADLQDDIRNIDEIIIKRAVEVNIDAGGVILSVQTTKDTVAGVLEEQYIYYDEDDEITPELFEHISEGMTIEVARIDYATAVEGEVLGYRIEETKSSDIMAGDSEIAVEGVNGFANVTYHIILRNGEEVERRVESTEVLTAPVNKVIANGTRVAPAPVTTLASRGGSSSSSGSTKSSSGSSSSGGSIAGARMIVCRGTAYDGSYETLGKHNPRTALGEVPYVGIVAVDPKVIPLNTRLYIEAADGSYVYGYCRAGDTGVYGNHVDLFMGSRGEALRFGSRTVNVYILD